MATDLQIQSDVMQELKWDPSVSHEHIGVSVEHQVVSLSGNVSSFLEKLAAEQAARRVYGVQAVVNKIDVKVPGSLKVRDQDIAEALLNQFKWNPQIPDDLITINVESGWVTLSGDVHWDFERVEACACVQRIKGVRGLTSNLTIKTKKIEPSLVKQRIEEALTRKALMEAKGILVEVHGNEVTLSGAVHSMMEMEDAKGAAFSAPGVCRVKNNLQIVNSP